MFFACPKCSAPINRHNYIDGFVCDNNVGGKMCGYKSNVIIFSEPLPAGIFGPEFFRKLMASSPPSQEHTSTPTPEA